MKVYTVKEMATALGKHEETIKRWLRSGKFPNAFRNSDKEGWKIPESDLVHIKQGTGFVKEDSQQNQQVVQQEIEKVELVKLAYRQSRSHLRRKKFLSFYPLLELNEP